MKLAPALLLAALDAQPDTLPADSPQFCAAQTETPYHEPQEPSPLDDRFDPYDVSVNPSQVRAWIDAYAELNNAMEDLSVAHRMSLTLGDIDQAQSDLPKLEPKSERNLSSYTYPAPRGRRAGDPLDRKGHGQRHQGAIGSGGVIRYV